MEQVSNNIIGQGADRIRYKNIIGECEFLLSVFIFLPYISDIFNNIVRHIITNTYKLDTLLVYGLFGLLCLLSLKNIAKRIKSWQILIMLSVVLVMLISMLTSADQSIHIEVLKNILFFCFPIFLVAGTVIDFSKLKIYINKFALVIPYFIAFNIYVLGTGILENGVYSQSLTYYLLLPTIVLLSAMIERFSIKTLIPLLLSLFIMFSFGARGPLVCVALFAVLKFVFELRAKRNRWIFIVLICILGVLVYTYYFAILQWFINLFEKLGFSSRSVSLILDNSFFEDKSRIKIYQCCLSYIANHPLWGTGLINDRIYLVNALYSGENAIGTYPHNIFIEILMQFGIIFGLILLGILITLLSKCLLQKSNKASRDMILIYLAVGVFPLLFSESYIDSSNFYLLLGLCGASFQARAFQLPVATDNIATHRYSLRIQ